MSRLRTRSAAPWGMGTAPQNCPPAAYSTASQPLPPPQGLYCGHIAPPPTGSRAGARRARLGARTARKIRTSTAARPPQGWRTAVLASQGAHRLLWLLRRRPTWFKVCLLGTYISRSKHARSSMRGSPWHSQHAHTSPGLGRCGWGPPQSSGVGWALFTREKGTHLCPAELLCHRTAVARPTKAGLSHSRGTAASFVPHGRPESAGTASEAVHGERQGLCGAAKRAEFSRSRITRV